MNDRERISRLIGSAISECSSSGLGEVRTLLVRAMHKLGDVRERPDEKVQSGTTPSFSGMSRDQVGFALRAIEDMIEREKSMSDGREDQVNLFG